MAVEDLPYRREHLHLDRLDAHFRLFHQPAGALFFYPVGDLPEMVKVHQHDQPRDLEVETQFGHLFFEQEGVAPVEVEFGHLLEKALEGPFLYESGLHVGFLPQEDLQLPLHEASPGRDLFGVAGDPEGPDHLTREFDGEGVAWLDPYHPAGHDLIMAPGLPGLYHFQRRLVERGEAGRVVGAYDDAILIGDDQVPPYEGTHRFGELDGQVQKHASPLPFSIPHATGSGLAPCRYFCVKYTGYLAPWEIIPLITCEKILNLNTPDGPVRGFFISKHLKQKKCGSIEAYHSCIKGTIENHLGKKISYHSYIVR